MIARDEPTDPNFDAYYSYAIKTCIPTQDLLYSLLKFPKSTAYIQTVSNWTQYPRMLLMRTIGLALLRSPLSHSRCKILEDGDGTLPVNASIRDGDALLEATGALGRHLLVALIDIGLDHDTDNAGLAIANLTGDVFRNQRLISVVLVGVACWRQWSCWYKSLMTRHTMRAVNHHDFGQALLLQGFTGSLDTVLVEVGALGSTAENDKAVFVTACSGDGSQTLLCHTHKVMLRSRSANGIYSHGQTSIGTVLEANGEGETRSELSVQLRFGCSSTNSAK